MFLAVSEIFFILMVNHIGIEDVKMKVRITFIIFEGFFTLIYKRKILLAVVSHLECEMGPGPRIENIQNSVLPGLNLIHRVNTVGLCIVFFCQI